MPEEEEEEEEEEDDDDVPEQKSQWHNMAIPEKKDLTFILNNYKNTKQRM